MQYFLTTKTVSKCRIIVLILLIYMFSSFSIFITKRHVHNAYFLGVKNKSPIVTFSPNMVHNQTKAKQKMQLSTDTENQTDINDAGKIKNNTEF